MRFRTTEDEKKYLALRTELYLAISRLPPKLASAALRDLGKLETLIHWEGVRQGLACATINSGHQMGVPNWGMPDLASMRYPAVIATVYGTADTPLIDIERRHINRFGEGPERELIANHLWLDEKPMAFAPSTYAEFMGEKADPPPMIRVDADGPPVPVTALAEPVSEEHVPTAEDIRSLFESLDDDPAAPPPNSPETLERTRDQLLVLQKSGWTATSWPVLILTLHRHMGMDASFLDLMLSSEQGSTMLRQLGIDVRPGAAVTVNDLTTEGPLVTGPADSDDDAAGRSST